MVFEALECGTTGSAGHTGWATLEPPVHERLSSMQQHDLQVG